MNSRSTRRESMSPSRVPRCLPGPTRPIWHGARPRRSRGAGQPGLILGADTICVVEGEILNKPLDRADAERMIRLQEGRNTHVISGICLYRVDRHEWVGAVEVSVVQFKPLGDAGSPCLSRLGAMAREVGGLRRAGQRPVRRGRPRQLFQRGRAPPRAARGIVANLSGVGVLSRIVAGSSRRTDHGVNERGPGTSIRGSDRMAPRLIGHRYDVKAMVKYVLLAPLDRGRWRAG